MEKVEITHKETGGTATVTRRSYERVWKGRGWRLAKSKKQTTDKENEN